MNMFKFNRKIIAKTKNELVESINKRNTFGKIALVRLEDIEICQGINAYMKCLKCEKEMCISVKSIYSTKRSLEKHCIQCEIKSPIKSRLYQGKEFFDPSTLLSYVNRNTLINTTINITKIEKFYSKGITSKSGKLLFKVLCECSVCKSEFSKPLSDIEAGNYDCFMCENEWKREIQELMEHSSSGEEFISDITPENFSFLRYKSEFYDFDTLDNEGTPSTKAIPYSPNGYNPDERTYAHKNGWFGSETIVEYTCDQCDFLLSSIAHWLLRRKHLNKPKNCPKCIGITLTQEERETELNSKHPDLNIIEWKGDFGRPAAPEDPRIYPSTNTHLVITCSKNHTYEAPLYKVRNKEHECPICIGPNWALSTLLREAENRPDTLYQKRYLYWVKFTHLTKHYSFWKVGLASTKNLTARYPKHQLAKDFVKMQIIESIPCTNYEAIITERFILIENNEHLKNEQMTLVNSAGGTECFNSNILEQSNLKEMISTALAQELVINGKVINVGFDTGREGFST